MSHFGCLDVKHLLEMSLWCALLYSRNLHLYQYTVPMIVTWSIKGAGWAECRCPIYLRDLKISWQTKIFLQ